MRIAQLSLRLDTPSEPDRSHEPAPPNRRGPPPAPPPSDSSAPLAAGEKAKARELLAAIRTLKSVETEQRAASPDERLAMARFAGFGPVALFIFPDPVSRKYKDAAWASLGEELHELLTPDEYASAKRTTFNAFYTSSSVIQAMYQGLRHLGVPDDATVLEPGCGPGRFLYLAPKQMRFTGVEMDGISGRIARALFPDQDIRIENFADSKLPAFDAVIGNVPFADIKLDHHGHRFALHDYFMAKSVDVLAPGGVLALVTSHYTLDKQNAAIREYLADRADFLGAIRLPSDAFRREGTAVVTDILFLRKRAAGEAAAHADPGWLKVQPFEIEGSTVPINTYFLSHPEMVLGTWTAKDSLYGEGYGVIANGDLPTQLKAAIGRLPSLPARPALRRIEPESSFTPPPPERHITEGSFFVGEDQVVRQVTGGKTEPVTYCGVLLRADGTPNARRIAGLIGMRDLARRVLQSQNEGWPETHREDARRELNRAYDAFAGRYGPVNKTTFSETADGSVVRRMPNLVKFREDPDAMLVMSLEEYDEVTGEAKKAPILKKDVVGRTPPVTHVTSAEEGLLVSLDRKGEVDLPFIAGLYGRTEDAVVAELGDLIYREPGIGRWVTADEYLSGNVRAKLVGAEKAGAAFARNAGALRAVQPEDVLPGDIDANLGAPWIPAADVRAFAAHLFQVPESSVQVAHLAKDAVWSVEGNWEAERAVANTTDYGTSRASGLWLLDLALNMKTPAIYDPVAGEPDKRVLNPEATLAAKEKQKLIKEQFRSWIFCDPDRTERLVRLYNDTYNNLRPRLFDGSHLAFPGMSREISLRPHQADAVWRGMSGGNTLLAHVVGAGKSFTIAATAMKMKQAGLIQKPLIVVPNHLLEQFAREFQQLYPNAHLLVAGKDDFTRERRKYLTAKIASGDWDAIIVTHSSLMLASRYPRIEAVTGNTSRPHIAGWRSIATSNYRPGRRFGMIRWGWLARIREFLTFTICLSRRISSLSAQTIRCFPEGVRREWIHPSFTQ